MQSNIYDSFSIFNNELTIRVYLCLLWLTLLCLDILCFFHPNHTLLFQYLCDHTRQTGQDSFLSTFILQSPRRKVPTLRTAYIHYHLSKLRQLYDRFWIVHFRPKWGSLRNNRVKKFIVYRTVVSNLLHSLKKLQNYNSHNLKTTKTSF